MPVEHWLKMELGKAMVNYVKSRLHRQPETETKEVFRIFDARMTLRLSGVKKALAEGLQGTLTSTVTINGDKEKGTVKITIKPPDGATRLVGLARSEVFHDGPIVIDRNIDRFWLELLSKTSVEDGFALTLTGNKLSDAKGFYTAKLPQFPEGVELEVSLYNWSSEARAVRPFAPPPSYWSHCRRHASLPLAAACRVQAGCSAWALPGLTSRCLATVSYTAAWG